MIWEVFRQERKGQAFQHAGAVEAPDASFAEWYAREQYGRRGESEALWVVPRESILRIEEFVDDLEASGARAVVAGATLLDFQPNSDHCFVYADPAGHPFCLSTWDGPQVDDEPGP